MSDVWSLYISATDSIRQFFAALDTSEYYYAICILLASLAFILIWGKFGGIKENGATIIIRPIWTAYVKATITLNIGLFAALALSKVNFSQFNVFSVYPMDAVKVAYSLAALILLNYSISCYQSWSKFIQVDGDGVWKSEGILPWTRAWDGLYWKDVERAWQIQGFLSWLLKSWKVQVQHRFLSNVRFVVNHMPSGTSHAINQYIQKQQLNTSISN